MRLAPMFPLHGTMIPLPSGMASAYATLRQMRALVNRWKVSPEILNAVTSIIYLTPPKDENAEAIALFDWVRDYIRYQRDVVGVEVLSNPVVTMQRMVGDCDDQATLLATFFESAGYPTRFVIAGYSSPGLFEHVYLQVLIHSQWIDADPTEEQFVLGDSPPNPIMLDFEKV